MKIDFIFNNLYEFMNIDKTIEISDIKIIEKIDLIEKLFNVLIKQKKDDKLKYPVEYDKLMKKIERETKFEQTKLILEKQNQQFMEKINKIIKKSDKIILIPKRKVDENLFLKNKLTKKLQKQKNKIIDKDNYEEFEY
jgi:paraquat-inducible protein B